MSAGKLKAHFAGGGVSDEFLECRRLCLPSKSTDRPSLRRLTRPLTCAEPEDLASGGCLDRLVGYGVDLARSEQRRRVPLRATNQDLPVPPGERLAPGVVCGIGAVAVQHHAARLLEACMDRGRESRISLWFAAR